MSIRDRIAWDFGTSTKLIKKVKLKVLNRSPFSPCYLKSGSLCYKVLGSGKDNLFASKKQKKVYLQGSDNKNMKAFSNIKMLQKVFVSLLFSLYSI